MNATRKLALYLVLLAAVLGGSMAVGAAAEPTGLANARPEQSAHGGGMAEGMVPGLAAADDDFRLEPATDRQTAGTAATYRFRVRGDDGVVTDFDVEHTKRMHLIVVRRDFAGFQHLHPTMAVDGTWETRLRLDTAGTYRVFADFVVDGDKHTLGTDLFVPGAFEPESLLRPSAVADAEDGYRVSLSGSAAAGEESTLRFVVRHDGVTVRDLQPYLGARGHLVALRDGDLGYLHVHAEEDRLEFRADFPSAGAYRLFLQFRHGGRVRTAAFTIDAREAAR